MGVGTGLVGVEEASRGSGVRRAQGQGAVSALAAPQAAAVWVSRGGLALATRQQLCVGVARVSGFLMPLCYIAASHMRTSAPPAGWCPATPYLSIVLYGIVLSSGVYCTGCTRVSTQYCRVSYRGSWIVPSLHGRDPRRPQRRLALRDRERRRTSYTVLYTEL